MTEEGVQIAYLHAHHHHNANLVAIQRSEMRTDIVKRDTNQDRLRGGTEVMRTVTMTPARVVNSSSRRGRWHRGACWTSGSMCRWTRS